MEDSFSSMTDGPTLSAEFLSRESVLGAARLDPQPAIKVLLHVFANPPVIADAAAVEAV